MSTNAPEPPYPSVAHEVRMLAQEVRANREATEHGLREVADHLQRLDEQVTETNGRVRGLEVWRARVQGVLAASGRGAAWFAGIGAAFIASLLTYIATH